jgi:hypothetical protein
MDEFKMGTGCCVGTTVTNVSGISRFSVISGNIYGLDSGNLIVFRNGLLAELDNCCWRKWSGLIQINSITHKVFYVDAAGNIFVATRKSPNPKMVP